MEQEYYLGLDMGTGSVGWAVTDSEYHVLRKHGKALWGVRLFESASTAEERRMFRTSRRRLDRRNWRIEILQEIFAEEISKKDPGFFLRMKESKYYPEDKRDINGNCPELPYALFVDDDFTDKDYHKKFPTIYHLRKMLMNTEETPDIRLVYLAIHHMMKHRGHFLLSGDINEIKEFGTTFSKLLENIKNEELDWNLELGKEEYAVVESILKDNMLNRSTKKTRLIKALKAKSICEKAVLNLLAGGTVKLSDIFGLEELNETERPKISFADNGYDDYIGEVENELGEQFYIIETAKAVYDWAVLVEILGKYTSISEAKVATYEKHKSDLQFLKKIVRKYLTKEEYKDIFVSTSDKLKNYSAYIGMTKINGKKVDLQSKRCSKEEFYDFIKKNVLKKLEGQPEYEYLKEELERETFLPKQVNRDNGVIPYQIHLYELKKILGNLRDKIDLIKENEDKLVQLFEFRIPYYVGPLNKIDDGKEEKFTWAVRKSNEKIYPWNFENVVDIEASAEKFIRRMTNKCTYLMGEDVLPKGRCMYSGEVIELKDLWDNTKYDIDHIYPQSKTMDDSLNNRVLVKKKYNATKSDKYPLNENIRHERKGFWKSLLDGGFISKEKYERLIRNTELSPEELAGFIERQIVETRQSTKAVAEILKQVFPESEIVYVKAGTVSRFRKDFELLKVREVNDLHHAKDAYLNIVVGNSYYVKFTKNASWFIKENPGRTYNLKKMFTSGWNIERNGEVAWEAGKKGTIVTVKQIMNKNNILVTRQVHEAKGGLFDQQIMKKGKGQIAIKETDERLASIEKYGGYNKAAGAYFMLVESKDKKGKTIRTIEFIPLYLKNKIESDESIALNFLEKGRGLKEPKILLKKIKIDTLFDVDGFKMWLSGRTGDRLLFKCANQLILDEKIIVTMKKIVKFIQRRQENRELKLSDKDGIDNEVLMEIYNTFVDKLENTVYRIRLSEQAKTLIDKQKEFERLSLEDKSSTLFEILHIFQCQSSAANLKMIGGPGKAGILVMNNNISKCNKISIINQSPTGIFENEIDLLKI